MSPTIIQAKAVSVDIPIIDASRSFRSALFARYTGGTIQTAKRRVTIRALENLDLRLRSGDRLGVVGHNGSGKTTLLRLIAGVYEPTEGTIARIGRVSALFNPALGLEVEETGLQNMSNIGLYLGMTQIEIREKTPEIIEFCELGDFIHLPVRTYSSGMVVRLGFAIATALDPEILVLDEAIGAGDARFAERAKERFETFCRNVQTVVLASHSNDFIRQMCNRVIMLEHGRLVMDGPVEDVMQYYERYVEMR